MIDIDSEISTFYDTLTDEEKKAFDALMIEEYQNASEEIRVQKEQVQSAKKRSRQYFFRF